MDVITKLMFGILNRHMLNVSWEHKDLSFNSDGYLTNPSMVIIALDRERLWDKVIMLMYAIAHHVHKTHA